LSRPLERTACSALEYRGRAADLERFERPVLLALVATEEEFDWSAAFSRAETSTRAIDDLHLAQELFESFGLVPTYALDYPVAQQRGATFRPWLARGTCEVGAHLHPWVNPPHDEVVGDLASFPGNLPPRLEHAKLAALVAAIENGTGARPRVYQAGRYGIAPHTHTHLAELGFRVDASVAPPFDYRTEGGPNFARFPTEPYWVDRVGGLLEVPVTGAYLGGFASVGPHLHGLVRGRAMDRMRVGGVLSRLKLLERSRLSPEGHGSDDMIRLVRHLARRGQRVFTFYFHSPTLTPGCTEYVRDAADRQRFLDDARRFLDWFLGELGGEVRSYSRLYEELSR
jgi:hypothetical protein